MVMHKGGMFVERGLYWSPLNGRQVKVREDGRLPGDESNTYLKLSPAVLLVIAPLFGMMYVMFLPLFGIGVFIVSWLVPVIGTLSAVALTGARISSKNSFFNWNPTRAYLSGVRKNQKGGGKGKAGTFRTGNGRR
jgi:hypothetical protein